MSAIVEFRSVSYRIPAPGGREVLRDFNLSIGAGETVVLLGRSGSGKTTALKMVNGLLFPTAGEVVVEGKPTTAWDPVRLRRRIGYVIQEVGLFPHFTVERNVGLVPRLEGWAVPKIGPRVAELLMAVGLAPEEYAPRYPRELSGGQRQRVGVARALAADPAILLFDEPFGALDPVTRLELQRQFLGLRERMRKTSLFVTHDVREALLVASRIGLLHNGQLELVAAPEAFRASRIPEALAFLAVLDGE